MKNFTRISMLVLGAVAASAQYVPPVTAYIPFEFSVPGATMAAGTYSVNMNQRYVLTLQSADGRVSASILSHTAEAVVPKEGARLVFHRIGGQYFLAQVWSAGTYGRNIPVTNEERKLAKRDTDRTTDLVVLAAR